MRTVNTTRTGRICQHWASRGYTDASFTGESVADARNYCRNPDNDPNGIWCFTTDPAVSYDYCRLPICRNGK